MTEWLAVVAFCIGSECAFWASTEAPFNSRADCQKVVAEAEQYFNKNGVTQIMSVCIPLKWVKV